MELHCRQHDLPIRVTWEHTDTAGYVHNSVVFRWFEMGELEWFRALSIHWKTFPEHGFPRTHVEADFLVPLAFDDLCILRTDVAEVRAAGYTLRHEMTRDGERVLRGRVTVCAISARTGRPAMLPEAMRRVLEPLCRPAPSRGGDTCPKSAG